MLSFHHMAASTQPASGYANIEKLIDSEDFNEINRSFTAAYKELEVISREKKGLKRNKEAKKAMVALEKVVDLLKELLQIKYRMQEHLAKGTKKGP